MMRMYPASWAVSWAVPSHMVSIQGVKVAAIHTPLTRAPSSTVTEIRLLAAAKPSCRSRRSRGVRMGPAATHRA